MTKMVKIGKNDQNGKKMTKMVKNDQNGQKWQK